MNKFHFPPILCSRYSIVSSNYLKRWFSINVHNGTIIVNKPLDREGAPSHYLIITATESSEQEFLRHILLVILHPIIVIIFQIFLHSQLLFSCFVVTCFLIVTLQSSIQMMSLMGANYCLDFKILYTFIKRLPKKWGERKI